MRARSFFCSALFARFVLLPALLLPAATALAQFQDPTKEELSMTADPKAPGAAAVYLNYEEKTDDTLHYHSVYARIKVLTEKGKDLATVEVPYARGEQKVTAIRARTIHPDGTVIPLAGKPEDLLAKKSGDKQIGKRVLNLPSVEVGSILEYQYDIQYDDTVVSSPYWEIQKMYFLHNGHYFFVPHKSFLSGSQNMTSHYVVDEDGNPANTLIWWSQLPTGSKIVQDAVGRFTLDVADVPAIPHEEYMPPIDAFLYQVLFYYKSAHTGTDYWVEKAKKWSKDVDHFAEPTGAIKNAVAGIVKPGNSDLDKAQKLYEAVQALDNTDFTRAKGKAELKALGLKPAKRAEDTWAQKSGSSQDIALLYLAMLRAAGLTAYDMRVVNRNRSLFQLGYLYFGQLDDDLVVLSTGGKDYVLDPGEKMCPFQTVSWIHSAASGVRQSPNGGALWTTPQQLYTENSITRIGDVTLDASGTISGSLRFIMTGQQALRWRQRTLERDTNEVKKEFDRGLERIAPEGVNLELDHFLGFGQSGHEPDGDSEGERDAGNADRQAADATGIFLQLAGAAAVRRPGEAAGAGRYAVSGSHCGADHVSSAGGDDGGGRAAGREDCVAAECATGNEDHGGAGAGDSGASADTGAYASQAGPVSGSARVLPEGSGERPAADGADGGERELMSAGNRDQGTGIRKARFLYCRASLGMTLLCCAFALPALMWARSEPAPDWAVEAAKTPTPATVGGRAGSDFVRRIPDYGGRAEPCRRAGALCGADSQASGPRVRALRGVLRRGRKTEFVSCLDDCG